MIKVLLAMAAMLGVIRLDDKITAHFNNRPKNGPQAKVVRAANDAEIALYKKPADQEALGRFKELVVDGSAKAEQVLQLVAKAVANKSKLEDSSTHKVKILGVKVEGEFATVTTKETSHFKWSSGKSWAQKDNPHSYRLQLIEGRWKVTADEFKY